MVVSRAIDEKRGSVPYLHRTFHNRESSYNPTLASMNSIWDVAMATSAAPPYFEAHVIGDTTHHDGAVGYNNPAQVVLVDLRDKHGRSPRLIMSIGTGVRGVRRTLPKKDQLGQMRRSDTRWQRFQKHVELASALPDILTDREDVVTNVRSRAQAENFSHFRFDVPNTIGFPADASEQNQHCLGEVPLDEWIPRSTGDDTLAKIRTLTEQYLRLDDTITDLYRIARTLVLVRRQRARTDRWEPYATDLTYRCCEDHCGLDTELKNRPTMRDHLERMHRKTGDELEETLNKYRRAIPSPSENEELARRRRTQSHVINGRV